MTLPESRGDTYRISLVCLGNICRSPMAEAVLRARLDEAGLSGRVAVDSAGTGSWHVGEPADPRARAALRRRGYDGEAHRARQLGASWFDSHDLVLALDHANLATLLAMAPTPDAAHHVRLLRSFDESVTDRDDHAVPDPYYGTDADFDTGLDIIERAADGLVDALRWHLGADQAW